MAKFILWAPRVLSLIILVFLSIMIYQIYHIQPSSPYGKDLIINIIPVLILFAGIVIGWRFRFAGGIVIMALGLIMTFFLKKYGDLVVFLPLASPILVTGILYILSFLYERQTLRNKNA